jgi:inner membrane protein
MDTLTHALSGVLAAQAAYGPIDPRTDRGRLIAVGLAAAFPDLDFALMLVDPLAFLNLHRGPTHSLLLLPLWAGLLALPLGRILPLPWRLCAAGCALGLFVHILGDWVTLYGTRLFYPLSEHAYSLDISFDVNPWIAAVALIGWLASVTWHRRFAAATLAVIAVLLAGQAALRQSAQQVAAAQAARWGLDRSAARVLPQPLSPFHWGLVVADAHGYRLAYLNLAPAPTLAPIAPLGWLGEMAAAYRPAGDLEWAKYRGVDGNALARRV